MFTQLQTAKNLDDGSYVYLSSMGQSGVLLASAEVNVSKLIHTGLELILG